MASETARYQESFQNEIDSKTISKLIHAMTMAAGKLLAYPDGHPFVIESFQKVENILDGIFESQSQLTFKIAKNTIIWESTVLDEKNPVFQRFAQTLFEHGIIGLTLEKGLITRELMDFDAIISQKRNDVYQQGGIHELLSEANIGHIQTRLIDYGLFQTQEGIEKQGEDKEILQCLSFWQTFVRGIFEKTLDPFGSDRESWIDIDPELLAAILNDKHLNCEAGAEDGLRLAFTSGMKNLDLSQLGRDGGLTKRLFRFIQSLDSELRQSFIEAFFNSLPDDNNVDDNILSGLPDEIILDALEKHTNQGLYIPPNVLKVLQKLAKTPTDPGPEGADELLDGYSRDDLVERLKTIFREDEADRFLPQDYQKILSDVISFENISVPELSSVPQLERTLTDQSISASVAAIIVEMIAACGDSAAVPEVLVHSLRDRLGLLVSSGDFRAVSTILERIGEKKVGSQDSTEVPLRNLVEVFSDKSFTQKVLESSRQWGKEKYPDIKKLITLIGPPFIEPLLDLLADEESRALRLHYLDTLKGLGVTVKDPAIRRLGDRRWYFTRNLLVILRHLNDPSILDSIRGLFGHSHTRVRQEALHTLLALGDPRADRILLDEMNSSDGDRCVNAIKLAAMTQSREITGKLAELLKKRGFSKTGFEIKKASVHALADIGDTSILPILQDVLRSFSLFFHRKSHLIKIEIIDSLGRYPAVEAAPILRSIAQGRPGALAGRALLVMKTLKVDKA
jgi:HEAT repeat protein